MRIDRRTWFSNFGKTLAYGLATPYVLRFAAGSAEAQLASERSFTTDEGTVFDLSVASGDPSSSGVILWTRVRPEAVVPTQPLRFQVSASETFATLLLEGEVGALELGSTADGTVKIDLDGRLAVGSQYFYRFLYGSVASRVGRCRTLPRAGARSLKLAVLTCQDYTNGYYGALRYLADDASIDFVVHLGDFIYESAGDPRFQTLPFPDRYIVLPSGSTVALGLSDYRHIYRTYRSDPSLQRAMERHTWILSHDDHEIANDCYWDYERDTLGAPDHPYVDDALALRRLKLEAQRAWSEYVPARVSFNASASHPHDALRSFRSFQFGDLLRLAMLDTRSYRSPHPCGEGDVFERYLPIGCSDFRSASQTMLGAAQRPWLVDTLAQPGALWNVVGNQTFFARLSLAGALPINVDAWDGYEAERRWIAQQIRDRRIANVVFLTGDLHSYIASQLKVSYDNLNPLDTRNQVGVEFMTPSVTSSALFDQILRSLGGNDQALANGLTEAAVRLNNPHIRFFNSSYYGYSTISFNREYCEWIAYDVQKNVAAEVAPRRALARFRKYTSFPFLLEQSTSGF